MKFKKLLTFALAITMVFSMIPVSAMATETEEIEMESVEETVQEASIKNTISSLKFLVKQPEEGMAPEAATCMTSGVSIGDYWWLDKNRKNVTSFVAGETYYLEMEVAIDNPDDNEFGDLENSVYFYDENYENEVKGELVASGDSEVAVSSCAYVAVKAKNRISELSFEVAKPIVGEVLGAPVCTTEGVEIDSYHWVDENDENMEDDAVCMEGKSYRLFVTFVITNSEENKFSLCITSDVYINGVKKEYGVISNGDTWATVECNDTDIKEKNRISEVYIEVEEPVAGRTPGVPVCTTEGVSIDNYFWFGEDGTLTDEDVFVEGKSYSLRIGIKVDDPEKDKLFFTSMDDIYFNGVKTKGGLFAGEETEAGIGCEFTAKKAMNKISEVRIEVDEPVAGRWPAAPSCITEGVSISSYSWNAGSAEMADDDEFVEGETYSLRIAIAVDDPENDELVNISGNIYFNDVKGEYFAGDEEGAAIGRDYTATKAKNKITKVYIDVEKPVAGKAPGEPVCMTEGVSISSYTWFGEGGSEVKEFEEGKEYSLRIGITVDNPDEDKFFFETLDDIYFNGVKTKGGLFAGEEAEAAVGCEFTATKAKNKISEVYIEVEEPVAGRWPAAPSCITEGVSISSYSWIAGGAEMAGDDEFVEGKNYSLRIAIAVDDPENDELVNISSDIYFNGVKGEYFSGDEEGAAIGRDYTAAKAKNKISSVYIEVEEPEGGKAPGTPVSKTEGVSIGDYTWFGEGGSQVTKFVAGKNYSLRVGIKVDNPEENEFGDLWNTIYFNGMKGEYFAGEYAEAGVGYDFTAKAAGHVHESFWPVFTWSEDGKICTAHYKCSYCQETVSDEYDCVVTSAVEVKATETEMGTTRYTAVFTLDGREDVDTKAVQDIPVLKVTAPVAKTLTYTGSAQKLLTAGSTNYGKMYYSLTQTGGYSTTVPSKTDIGSYTVYYKVVGDEGHKGISAKAIPVYIRPAKPTITSWANTSTGIKLVWSKVDKASGYIIYRGGSEIKRVDSKTLTYTDTGVKDAKNGTAYSYKVKAYTTTASGKIACASPTGTTAYRIQAPASMTLSAARGYVKVSYTAPSGVGYAIYRATSVKGTYSPVKTGITSGTYWKDTGVTKGKTYYYKIKAYKTINGKKYYSAATVIKSITAK